MTRDLLDTNIISDARRGRPHPRITEWLGARSADELWSASIVVGEIWRGIEELADGQRKRELTSWFESDVGPQSVFATRILPFDEVAAVRWGAVIAEGRRLGRPRSPLDMQIAAIAMTQNCVLATRNVHHFVPIADHVEILDPAGGT